MKRQKISLASSLRSLYSRHLLLNSLILPTHLLTLLFQCDLNISGSLLYQERLYITNLYLASDSILGTSQICVHFAHRHSQREWTTRLKRFQGALWVVCLKIIAKAFLDTQFTICQAPSRNTVVAQSSGPGLLLKRVSDTIKLHQLPISIIRADTGSANTGLHVQYIARPPAPWPTFFATWLV